MLKKLVIVLLIVLIITVSILLIRELILKTEKNLEKTENLSQEDVIDLLNKGRTYNNYYLSRTNSNNKEEYYYKDNILTYYINSELKYWINLSENNKEMIIIDDVNTKTASKVENFEEIDFPNEYSQLGYYSTIYDKNNIKFKYLGKIYYNDRPTIVAKTTLNDNFKTYENKYYIDENTGVIVNRIDIQKIAFVTTNIREHNRGIKFDVVTDKDIEKPNLQNFKINSCRFPTFTIW